MTVKKQTELDEARRREMRDREEEYKDRVRALEEWRKEKEEHELKESDIRLKLIQDKLSKSQLIHSKVL